MTQLLRVVDTETTGLDTAKDKICQIATLDLLVDGKDIKRGESWSSYFNPEIPIPAIASAIHDITDKTVKDAPLISVMLPQIRQYLQRGDPAALVAHNAGYDHAMIGDTGKVPWIDTWKVAVILWPDAPSHKNTVLRYWLNLWIGDDLSKAHNAAVDVIITGALVRRMLARGATIEEMIDVSGRPVHLPRLHFGEHRGKPIAEVPSDYLQWILREGTFEDNVRYTAQQELQQRRGHDARRQPESPVPSTPSAG